MSTDARRAARGNGDSGRLAVLDQGALWIANGGAAHAFRENLPDPSACSAASLLELARCLEIAQLWLHPSWTRAAGLPEELIDPAAGRPVSVRNGIPHPFVDEATAAGWDSRPAGLAPWLHAFQPGTYGAIDLVLPQYDRRGDFWQDAADGETLLLALVYFDQATGVRYRRSPEASSSALLRELHQRRGGIRMEAPEELPPPALDSRTEWDCMWARPPLPAELAVPYVHSYDKNGAYLSVCGSLSVGAGSLVRSVPAVPFDKRRPGYWRAAITLPADELAAVVPDPFHREGREAGKDAWYSTPTIGLACEIGARVYILESYTWTAQHRPLEPWYKQLRDARTTLATDTASYPQRAAAALALRAVKLAYGPLLGGRMASTIWDRTGDPLYRPDIRHAVLAQVRANQYRVLRRMAEQGVPPLLVESDAISIVSADPDPVQAAPPPLRLGDGLGAYKVKDAALPADMILPILHQLEEGMTMRRVLRRIREALAGADDADEGGNQ
jgi:hypothetical protein